MSRSQQRPARTADPRNARRRAEVDRRREFARKRRPQAVATRHSRQRRVRIVAGVVGAAVTVAAIVAIVIATRPEAPPSKEMVARRVDGAAGALAISAIPATYRLTYRNESYATGSRVVTTREVIARRPFDSRVVGTEGAEPGGAEVFSVRSTLGVQHQSTTGGRQTTAAPPGTGLGDFRLDASLADLVADGTFVLGARRSLIGRECQEYRTGMALEAYAAAAPTATDYADLCIDGNGLVLEQLVVATGMVTEHQVATAVDTAPALSDADFTSPAAPTGPADGGSELSEIDLGTAPVGSYWTLSGTPAGFTHRSRHAYRQSIPDPAGDPASSEKKTVVTSYADVYVRGHDVLIVRQGPASVDPGADDTSVAHDLGTTNLGTARSSSGVRGTTVSAHPGAPESWFVHVVATVPRADLEPLVSAMSAS